MNIASTILRDLGYSEDQALRDFALLQTSQKHAELQLEDNYFHKKYEMTFSEFETKLRAASEERFDKEDDYLAWKFAHDGVQYWKTQLDSLRRAS